jgi:hypothetical protein
MVRCIFGCWWIVWGVHCVAWLVCSSDLFVLRFSHPVLNKGLSTPTE